MAPSRYRRVGHLGRRVARNRRGGSVRVLRGVSAMYRYCRDGHGYPNGRLYSAQSAITWAWRYR